MPDWLTYVLSAWVVSEVLFISGRRYARRYAGVAAIGSVLPDLVKPFYLLKTYLGLDLIGFSVPLATPVGAFLVAGLASTLFPRRRWTRAFGFLSIGVIIHLIWDSMLHPLGGGQLILFPFSFKQYSLGLIWSDSILPLLIVSVPFVILMALRVTGRSTHGGGGL